MTLTFEQAAAQLGVLMDRVEVHAARGLSFGLERHVREAAVLATVKRGFGRRLWGDARRGAFAMFKREPIRMSGGKLLTAVIVKGLAAMAETGGKTEAHVIAAAGAKLSDRAARAFKKGDVVKGVAFASRAARNGQLLTMTVRGKRLAAPWVNHPGSRIARNPAMAEALDANGEKVTAEIRKALDAFIASETKG